MKTNTIKILLITSALLIACLLSKAQVKGIPLTGSDAVSGRVSYNLDLSSTFRKYTHVDSNWVANNFMPLIGGAYIPLGGTAIGSPLTGLIDFNYAANVNKFALGHIPSTFNSSNFFYVGLFDSIRPLIATKQSGIKFAGNGLTMQYTIGTLAKLFLTNGTSILSYGSTSFGLGLGTAVIFSSDPFFKGITYDPGTCDSVNLYRDSTSLLHQGEIFRLIDSAVSSITPITQTITLTGDVVGTGTASIATTLATVNTNTGTTGGASLTHTTTVNAKGLTTATGTVSIQIAESQVTNLTSDLAGKQATLSGSSSQLLTAAGTTVAIGSNLSLTSNTLSATIPTAYISTVTTTGVSGASAATTGTLNIPRYDNATSLSFLNTATSLNSVGTVTTGAWNSSITVKDGSFTMQNTGTPSKQGVFDLSLITAATTRTFNLPDVNTRLLGQSGTNANTQIAVFTGANEVNSTPNMIYNSGRLSLEVGGSAPINTTQGIGIWSNTNNRALSISGSSQTTAKVMTFDNNTSSDNSMLQLYGTTYVGNLAGSSIPLLKCFEVSNGGSARINPLLLGGSRVYNYIGNTATNSAHVQDAIGLRVGLMSDIQTTNLNAFTVEGKTSLGANSAATYTLDVTGDIGFPILGNTIRLKTVATSTTSSTQTAGKSTLSAGTVTITNANVTAASLIYITDTSVGALTNVGTLTVVAGSGSFIVTSTNVLDTSTFNYFIIQPY